MAVKWAHSDVLDNGLAHIAANATRLLVLNNYSLGDSYATVVAAAVLSVTIDSADFEAITGAAGSPRVLGVKTQSGNASASTSSPDLHIALTDGSAKVLVVTDETSNQAITSGNSVTVPAFNLTANQPT